MSDSNIRITKLLSPTYLGSGIFMVSVFSEGTEVTPTEIKWQIALEDGTIVNNNTFALSAMYQDKFIILTPTDSLLVSEDLAHEVRFITVKASYPSTSGGAVEGTVSLAYLQIRDFKLLPSDL